MSRTAIPPASPHTSSAHKTPARYDATKHPSEETIDACAQYTSGSSPLPAARRSEIIAVHHHLVIDRCAPCDDVYRGAIATYQKNPASPRP